MPDYNRDAERRACELLTDSDRPAYRMGSESRTPTPKSIYRAEARPNELSPKDSLSRTDTRCATEPHLNTPLGRCGTDSKLYHLQGSCAEQPPEVS